MTWQPIATAPKDGIFLGWDADVGVYTACLHGERGPLYHWNHQRCQATHWMPLPAPPEAA
jgi:hypothetical protein